MRIDGEWHICQDGVMRPALRVEILDANGSWLLAVLLLDTGADRTTFDAGTLNALGVHSVPYHGMLAGLGGSTPAVEIITELRLTNDQYRKVPLKARFLAMTNKSAIEMPVLGRDILDLFAVIVDRPGNVVCLLSQHHQYRIELPGP